MPNAILVNKIDVPPILTNGSGTPVTGPKPTAIAMLANACIVILKLSPHAIKHQMLLAPWLLF